MMYEIRFGTDGIGVLFGGVVAGSIAEARERAAEKLRAEHYHAQADGGLFTVHGIRPVSIVTIQADLYAQRVADAWENRSELTSAEAAKIGTEIHERTERLTRDVYDDAPEFNRPPGPDEFDASGFARRVIEAMSNSIPLSDSDLNEALRDEIPYEGDGFGIRYDK